MNTFCTGSTPAQTVEKLVPCAMKKWGQEGICRRRRLQLRTDYFAVGKEVCQGQWRRDARDRVLSLDVTNFGPTIKKIEAAKPDFVMSALVGAAPHFVLQAICLGRIETSRSRCLDGLHGGRRADLIPPEESEGMLVSFAYSKSSIRPPTRSSSPICVPTPARRSTTCRRSLLGPMRESICGRKASKRPEPPSGTAVIKALRSPISFDGPSGKLTIDPKTNHLVQNIYLAE